jgi:hypothetical protein
MDDAPWLADRDYELVLRLQPSRIELSILDGAAGRVVLPDPQPGGGALKSGKRRMGALAGLGSRVTQRDSNSSNELTTTVPIGPKSANFNSSTLRFLRFLLFNSTGENGGNREVCPTDQGN